MTDRHRHEDDPRCLAFVCENASRGQTVLAGTAIARAADAMCRARGVPPNAPRLELVARVAALRATDLPAALAAEGVPAPRARALAPHVERMLDRDAFNALDRDRWVSITSAHGVPAAEHACLLLLGTLAIEAAHELATPPPIANAIVHIEPRERSPEGPWPGEPRSTRSSSCSAPRPAIRRSTRGRPTRVEGHRGRAANPETRPDGPRLDVQVKESRIGTDDSIAGLEGLCNGLLEHPPADVTARARPARSRTGVVSQSSTSLESISAS